MTLSKWLLTLLLSAAVLSASCNGKTPGQPPALPSAPSAVPPSVSASFAGAWQGNYTVTQCSGQRHCGLTRGRAYPFSLRVQQSGSRVHGVFHTESFAIPVDGEVSSEGELSLAGTRPSPGKYSPAVELTRFTARLSSTGLVADLEYWMRYAHGMREWIGGNSLEQSLGGTVASAERGENRPVNSFTGRWEGALIISDCSAEGWTACWPEERDREYGFLLTLVQSGERVTGELEFRLGRFQVSGTISGDTVTLEPAVREETQSSARLLTHLQHWIMAKDAVGSLRGEMHYVRETVWEPLLQRPPSVSRYEGRIVYGVPE
jgi:hypothetical protein